MAELKPIEGMTKSYARWRSSRLGQITDALEQQLILELLGSVAGKTLLDVGCGDGAFTAELARRGALVTGLDPDPVMIAAARQRDKGKTTQLRLIQGRVEALPFHDNSFDYTLSVTTLCFVQEAQRAITEMARVLKPGGRLVIGELGRWSLWAAQRRIRGWLGNPVWRAATVRTAAELRALIEASGLSVIDICGAVYYPPCGVAARLLAPVDARLGRTTVGAAFIAMSAQKPIAVIGSEGH